MPRLIEAPVRVEAAGTPPKLIDEYVELDVAAGQAVLVPEGEWVRYSTPAPGGAEYVAVCLPAFSPQTVRRDED